MIVLMGLGRFIVIDCCNNGKKVGNMNGIIMNEHINNSEKSHGRLLMMEWLHFPFFVHSKPPYIRVHNQK